MSCREGAAFISLPPSVIGWELQGGSKCAGGSEREKLGPSADYTPSSWGSAGSLLMVTRGKHRNSMTEDA